ncbi:sulfatase, partial [bacterium]|nr:sulfatase [bacterium]
MAGRRRFWCGSLLASSCLLLALSCAGCAREERRPNIVVLVLDTLRRDAAGSPTDATPAPLRVADLTPRLAGLSRDGVTFTGAYAAAPWTVPSHASMFTGKLPGDHLCTTLHPRLDAGLATFAGILRDDGYQTAAFYSNPWLADRTTGLLRGFSLRREAAIGGMFELRSRSGDQGGGETVRNIAGWLEERDGGKPFLLFANFMEPHLAYDPPRAYRTRALLDLPPTDAVSIMWAHQFNAGLHPPAGVDWNRVCRLYAGDVWSADRLMGEVLDRLAAHGLDDDTIVIVTSDHGENLGDHGLMDHQYSVHETLLAVPLVVYVPDAWRGRFDPGAAPGGE